MKEVEIAQAQAVAVPVNAPVAYGQQLATTAPGNGFLLGVAGLYVRQHLEIAEMLTGCETKNRYSVAVIPAGTAIPSAPDSNWSKQFRSSASFNPLLKAKEESECFERVCCPLFRGFTMPFKDGNGTDFLVLTRPFKCDPCYFPPCLTCNTQELSIAAGGTTIATAKEVTGKCCTSGCCQRRFEASNASGTVIYTFDLNDCTSKSGSHNCCAPTCFNEALTVDITDANGTLLPPSTFVWPGCNCGGLNDLSNFIIAFPDGTSADERSALIAGMFLLEFTVMELRRQNNKDNGGGGGGAPESKEMQR